MKCVIPEISWHNRNPVLSVDIQPHNDSDSTEFYRLASGGGDSHVIIWKLLLESSATPVLLADLERHQRSVNVVRWSPNGKYLASADDESHIILWYRKEDYTPSDESADAEAYAVLRILRGHQEDIYDLCWSPDSAKILSGSVDTKAIIWDVEKGKMEHTINEHKQFVQGVAWDPKNQYIATLGNDRTCRVIETSGRRTVKARIYRGQLPVDQAHQLHGQCVRYFYDDTYQSFFRRLTFTPDGNLLIAPSAVIENDSGRRLVYGTYIFTMSSFEKPAALLISPKEFTIAVRCCPVLFELRVGGPKPYIALPYRMIIAVATNSDILLYDTQQKNPFAHMQRIHYTRLTDMTWSSDGRMLTASSSDGYCSLATFDVGELGTIYVKDDSDLDDSVLDVSEEQPVETERPQPEEVVPVVPLKVETPEPKKRASFLEQWTKRASVGNNSKSQSLTAVNDRIDKGRKRLSEDLKAKTSGMLEMYVVVEDIKHSLPKFTECEIIDLSCSSGSEQKTPVKRFKPHPTQSPLSKADGNVCNEVEKPVKRIKPTLIVDDKAEKGNVATITAARKRITPTRMETLDSQKPTKRIIPTRVVTQSDSTAIPEKRPARRITPMLLSSPDDKKHQNNIKNQTTTFENKIPKKSPTAPSPQTSAKKLKNNTLLGFIQRKVSPKNNKLKLNFDSLIKGSSTQDCVVVSEEAAQDAWDCNEVGKHVEPPLIVLPDSDEEEKTPDAANAGEKENTDTIVDKKVESIKHDEGLKTVRRVPLITLSSPKNKKKPASTND